MKITLLLAGLLLLAACTQTVPTPDTIVKPTEHPVKHFVDAYPKQGDQFARVPDKVVVNFDVMLDSQSSITVMRAGAPLQTGAPAFGQNKISMSVGLPGDAGDGQYLVKFQGCLRDQTCNDGQFTFTVDSKSASTYSDFTGKSDVTIRMKDIQFSPRLVRVSPGTRITWINDDPIPHFVNSDPHPSHNAIPPLNTLELAQNASYSFTFDQPGEWSYHCSAHVPANMYGRVLVVPAGQTAPPPIGQAQISPTATRVAPPLAMPQWFKASFKDVRTGKTFSIADFQGKVVLVELMAVWCPLCLTQQQNIATLQKQSPSPDAVIVSFDIDASENADLLKRYVDRQGFTWLFALAPRDAANEIAALYGTQFLNPPSTPVIVIDRKGIAHPLDFGIKSAASLKQAVEKYLKEGS
ncbi:MAG: redoxin family protein [Chloroflexi bacterium]|nr:redoxin family protein [Chloroflexota bacterium]